MLIIKHVCVENPLFFLFQLLIVYVVVHRNAADEVRTGEERLIVWILIFSDLRGMCSFVEANYYYYYWSTCSANLITITKNLSPLQLP